MAQHEYAFDVKLAAVVRVVADSQKSACQAIKKVLDCATLDTVVGDMKDEVKITEASVYVDDCGGPYLFEIDGESIE